MCTARIPYGYAAASLPRPCAAFMGGRSATDGCNTPSCSVFTNVSFVLGVTAAERLPWLLDYSLWFASVTFMVSPTECGACECHVQRIRQRERRDKLACDCPAAFKTSLDHAAVTRGMQRAAAATGYRLGRPVQGVLFAHMDMWINVHVWQKAPLDSMWLASGGLRSSPYAPHCYKSGPAYWHKRVPGYIVVQTPGCGNATPPILPSVIPPRRAGDNVSFSTSAGQQLSQCCFGWADMFYVPTFALDAFAELSNALRTEFVEVGIPTVVTMLEKQANVSWHRAFCVGDCCGQFPSPTKYDPRTVSTLCGHKLALDKPQYRGLLTRTLHPNHTRAMELIQKDFSAFRVELNNSGVKYDHKFSLARGALATRSCNPASSEGYDLDFSPSWLVEDGQR